MTEPTKLLEQFEDDFDGDTPHLLTCIRALLSLDAAGALVPHGIGGHARKMLNAAAYRLSLTPTPSAGEDMVERVARAVMEILWKREQFNGVGPDYDTYREGRTFSMGGRVESYEREANDIARAALAAAGTGVGEIEGVGAVSGSTRFAHEAASHLRPTGNDPGEGAA